MQENNHGKPTGQPKRNGKQGFSVSRETNQHEETLEDVSHEELVRRIKEDLVKKREDWEKSGRTDPYDPIELTDFILTRPRRFNLAGQKEQQEKTQRLARAWAAISFSYMPEGQYRNGVRGGVGADARLLGRYVELEPKAVKLLDAMAEAVGVPRTRGKTRIDVLQYFPPKQQKEIEEYHQRLLTDREGRLPAQQERETNFCTFLRWVSKVLTPPEKEVSAEEKRVFLGKCLRNT